MKIDYAGIPTALKKLVDAGGGGQQFRQDQRKLQRTIRENQVYAVLCPDNENYYRTIFLKRTLLGIWFQQSVMRFMA